MFRAVVTIGGGVVVHCDSQTRGEAQPSRHHGAPEDHRSAWQPGPSAPPCAAACSGSAKVTTLRGDKQVITQDVFLQAIQGVDSLEAAAQLFDTWHPRSRRARMSSRLRSLSDEQHALLYALAGCTDVSFRQSHVALEVRQVLSERYGIARASFQAWFHNRGAGPSSSKRPNEPGADSCVMPFKRACTGRGLPAAGPPPLAPPPPLANLLFCLGTGAACVPAAPVPSGKGTGRGRAGSGGWAGGDGGAGHAPVGMGLESFWQDMDEQPATLQSAQGGRHQSGGAEWGGSLGDSLSLLLQQVEQLQQFEQPCCRDPDSLPVDPADFFECSNEFTILMGQLEDMEQEGLM